MLPDRGDGSVEAIDSVLTWNLIGSIDCDQRELYGKWQSSRNGRGSNVDCGPNVGSGSNVDCGPGFGRGSGSGSEPGSGFGSPIDRESGVGRQWPARFLWPGNGMG